MPTVSVVEKMGRAADFVKWDGKVKADGKGRGNWKRVDPPQNIAETLRQRATKRLLPTLVGIINAPTMRSDGTILGAPGYDAQTGLLLDTRGVDFPLIPDAPSRDDARAALDVLQQPIRAFPFVSDADKAVALSCMLTGLVRRTLRTAPAHCFSATVPGSGKGKLVNVAAVMSTGREAPAIAQGPDDAEFEKRLGSCLMDGRPIISVDNCTRGVTDFPTLCSIMTEPHVSLRVLGQSKTPTLPANILLTINGNNLVLVSDMVRRVVRCDLDPQCERPELREFDFDPVSLAKEMRPQLVAAGLTLLRAHFVAGRPRPAGVVHTDFPDWASVVRDALVWAGCADAVTTQDKVKGDDPVANDLGAVLAAWSETFGRGCATVAEAIKRASEGTFDEPEDSAPARLREALHAVAGRGERAINTRVMGKWLSANKGRIVGGYKFMQRKDDKHGDKWQVLRI